MAQHVSSPLCLPVGGAAPPTGVWVQRYRAILTFTDIELLFRLERECREERKPDVRKYRKQCPPLGSDLLLRMHRKVCGRGVRTGGGSLPLEPAPPQPTYHDLFNLPSIEGLKVARRRILAVRSADGHL